MRKTAHFVLALLLFADIKLLSASAPAGHWFVQAAQASTPAGSGSRKTIKDAAEYSAYITALNTQDQAAKAAAMEAFVKQYPNSVVKVDALEQAMAAYQQLGNRAKVEELAGTILQLEPNNVRALAILTFLARVKATQGDSAAAAKLPDYAERGQQGLANWPKPDGMSDEDFKKLRDQMSSIFYGAAGFAALQNKDYTTARQNYLKACAIDPNSMQDIYQLGIAELEMKPLDVSGFWYIARAIALANGNAAAQQSIGTYGKSKYHSFHGSADGWDQLVANAATQSAPPAGFSVKAKLSAAEIAVEAVKENDPADLSFSDDEFILGLRDASPANKDAADKVWAAIQAKQKNGQARLLLPKVKVISASTGSIDAAITEENQKANKADLRVAMTKPLLPAPAPGAVIDIVGVITSYTPQPFLFVMEKGDIPRPSTTPAVNAR